MRKCGVLLGIMILILVLLMNPMPSVPSTTGAMVLADESGMRDFLLADSVRPFVYYANPETLELEYRNATTGAIEFSLAIGGTPHSIDMSADMESIYIAAWGAGVVVVDIEGRSISRVLPLDGTPASACDGRADRLYVASSYDGQIRILNSTTGEVIETIYADVDVIGLDTYSTFMVAASPDGTTLLATLLEGNPTRVGKYDVSTDVPEYLGAYSGFGGYVLEEVFDWDAEVLYLISDSTDGDPGVERMSVAGLSWLAPVCPLPYGWTADNMAFSPDFNYAYVTAGGWLYAYTQLDAEAVSAIGFTSYPQSMIVDGANTSLFVEMDSLTRLSLSPEVFVVYPEQDMILYDPETDASATVWLGIPTAEPTSMGVMVDGAAFSVGSWENPDTSWMEVWEPGMIWGYMTDGPHTLRFWFAWDGGNVSADCSFTYETTWRNPPRLLPVFPEENSVLDTSPHHIDTSLYNPEGEEAVVLEAFIELDGAQLEVYTNTSFSVVALVAGNLTEDKHTVTAGLIWTDGTREYYSNTTWEFYVQNPPEFVDYTHISGFSLPIPSDWTVEEDVEVGDTLIELKLTGPTIHDVTVTTTVDVGLDPGIEEKEWYLEIIAQETVDELSDYGVEMWGDVESLTIDGHLAAKFRMNWTSPEITQVIVLIADEENQRYWIMTFTSSSQDYYLMSTVYDEMIAGFDTGDSWSLYNLVLVIALLGAVAASLIVVIVWLGMRKPRPKAPGKGPAVAPRPGAGFCPKCGASAPFSEAKCTSCGAELPSPPFGARESGGQNT